MAIELTLHAHRQSWSAPHGHGLPSPKRHPDRAALRGHVLARDKGICQGEHCGLQAKHFQEMHHRNHDHQDWTLDNLVTLCPLCHMVFHLPSAGLHQSGRLIWLPEATQGLLNRMTVLIHAVHATPGHPWEDWARQVEADMAQRAVALESDLGTSDPGRLAEVMVAWPESEAAARRRYLARIRLWVPYRSDGIHAAAARYWATLLPPAAPHAVIDLETVRARASATLDALATPRT